MPSILRPTILPAIAALSVSIGGVTPTVYRGATLPQSVESAILPCRIIEPFGAIRGGLDDQWTLEGPLITVNWQISDLLLWRAAASGNGIGSEASDLTDYLAAYFQAAKALNALQWSLATMQASIEVLEWPVGGGRFYHGVRIALTVLEGF